MCRSRRVTTRQQLWSQPDRFDFPPRRSSRRRRLHSARSCRGSVGPWRGVRAAADRGGRSAARVGSDDGKLVAADSAMAGRRHGRPGAQDRRTPLMMTVSWSTAARADPGRRRGRKVGSSTARSHVGEVTVERMVILLPMFPLMQPGLVRVRLEGAGGRTATRQAPAIGHLQQWIDEGHEAGA